MNIFKFEFKSNLIALLVWVGALSTIFAGASVEFSAFQGSEELKEFMEGEMFQVFFQALGADMLDMTTPEGFLSILSLYIYLPLSIYSGLLGAGIISKEEKNKTAEYLFTLPVSRRKVITVKVLTALLFTILINLIMIGMCALIFWRFSPDQIFYNFLLNLSIGVFFTQLCFLSVGFGLASVLKDYKKSGSITVAILISTFMISILVGIVDEAEFLKYITPFQYFVASDMLHGDFSVIYFILSLLITVTGVSTLYYFYQKRDLYI